MKIDMMTKDKDQLKEMLGMGISRRKMLKGMGYGLAGALTAPALIENVFATPRRPGAALSSYTPQAVWDYAAPDNFDFADFLLLDNGTIIITARDTSNYEGVLYSIDTQTKEVRWSYRFDTPFFTPLSINGVLYAAGNSGGISAIDPATGNTLWHQNYQAASNLQLIGGNLVFTSIDGNIFALDLQGNRVWYYGLGDAVGPRGASRAVGSGNAVMVMTKAALVAVDMQTGDFLWRHATDSNPNKEPAVGGGNVYLTDTFNLFAVDVATGNQVAKWPQAGANPSFLGQPFYYNGAVYLGDYGGNFHALRPDTLAELWKISVPGIIGSNLFFEDGIAYFAGGTSAGSKVYAVDLPSQGRETAFYDPKATATVIGVETGVAYFQYGGGLYANKIKAVNLAGIVHQYFCESELMVEDYTGDSNNYRGNTSSYRTHVQLVDENKNPRANKSVKVWASDAVTLSSGGQTYQIDQNKSIWLQTDGAGEVSLVSAAVTVSSPALYIWGNFMELDEAIVIYPDHDTLQTLSNVQGGDLSQANARTFDGTPMLPANYNIDGLADSIRNTMGGGAAQAMLKTRERQRRALTKKRRGRKRWSLGARADTTYISYPASTNNIIYQPIVGDSGRTYVQGAIPQWTATFDDAGNITFNPGGTLGSPELLGGFLGDLKQFGHDVVNTTVKVAKVVWDDTEKVVHVIVNELGDFYKDVADTIEKAVAVVAGLLKTIVNDIKKAVEWLSYLFDWEDMLSVKEQLKTAVNQKFLDLKTWTNNQLANDIKDVHTFFVGMENTLLAKLGEGNSAVGGPSMQSRQVDGNDPQAVYGQGGAKSYSQSRYLTTKYTDNAPNGSVGAPGASLPGADETLVTLMGQLFNNVSDIINNTSNNPDFDKFKSIPGDVLKVFQDFSLLVTDPSQFVKHSLSDIIKLVTDIAVALIQLADAAVEAFLGLLGQMIDAVIALVNQPIHIPILTDIWNLITHNKPFTVLDLMCWIVAVPTTIVQKVVDGNGSSLPGAIVLNQNIGYLFAEAINVVLDPLTDIFKLPAPMMIGSMALSFIIQGLSFPTDLATNTADDYVFYAVQAFPTIATGVDIAFDKKLSATGFSKRLWDAALPYINCSYGVGLFNASLWLGFTDSKYAGKDYLTLLGNLFTFIPYIAKPLGIGDVDATPPKLALGAIDAVCDATVMGLGVA